MKSYTVTLTSIAHYGIPQVLDHYLFFDPISGTNFVYPLTADGSNFPYSNGQPTILADDENFIPWGYLVQDIVTDIPVGPLKGPYNITFDTTSLDTREVDILKIVYNFGDGSPEIIINNEVIVTYTFGEPTSASSPAAKIISHNYYPQSNSSITTFTPSITAYYSNITRCVFNISISSAPISIYEFDDIHLINNTQQLTSIETQNIFEVESPDYLTVARVVSAVDTKYPTVIPFNPNTSVLNYDLITWLDASDSTTISKDQNKKVYIWYDKSAYKNNYFCNKNDGSDAPTFLYSRESQSGRKSVWFQSAPVAGTPSQYLYALAAGAYVDKVLYTYGQGFTMFAVMKLNRIGSKDTLFAYDLNTNEALRDDKGNGQNYLPYLNVSFTNDNSVAAMNVEQGNTSYYFGTSAYDPNNGIYQPVTTGQISNNLLNYSLFSTTISGNQNAMAYFTADTAKIRRENTLTTPVNFQNSYTTLSAFLSGGYNEVTGKTIPFGEYDYNLVYGLLGTSDAYYGSYLTDAEISEFMIFDRPLNTSEISSVQAYLVNKWGLTLQTD